MEQAKKICIIDDDPIFVFTTKKRLEVSGFCEPLLVYKNGKEAFDGLKTAIDNNEPLPDVIFLDINMPIWDGWDFLNAFSKIPTEKKINLFIVSSSNYPDDIEKAKSYNTLVSDFIVKPITAEKIEYAMRGGNEQ